MCVIYTTPPRPTAALGAFRLSLFSLPSSRGACFEHVSRRYVDAVHDRR
jgi:hypothetical protein